MKNRVVTLSVAVLVMIGATAGSLRWLKTRVRMGSPGVRIVKVPVISDEGRLAASNSVYLPSMIPGYQSEVERVPELELGYLPPDTTFGRRIYRANDGFAPISSSIVLMGSDRTSIHRPQYCLTGVGWQIFKRSISKVQVKTAKPFDLDVQRYDMTREFDIAGRKVRKNGVYVFWFVADGIRTASEAERQWRMITDIIARGESPRWAYLAFFTTCEPGEEDAAFARIAKVVSLATPGIEEGSAELNVTAVVDRPE